MVGLISPASCPHPWYIVQSSFALHPFVMEISYLDQLFDHLGKLFFARQPDWERRRNAKIMTTTVLVSAAVGSLLIWLLKYLSAVRK
jgi:hypothetical protein